MRNDGRLPNQMRPIRFVPGYTKNAHGSVLVEYGDTKVLCTVNIEPGVPSFLRNASPPQGWLTAEYGMLPGSTSTRCRRERPQTSGRSQEIQRLIGRALRGIIDLNRCPDLTFYCDCDVLQADGGTRTAAISGAYVALKLAVDGLMAKRKLTINPIKDGVAAVSVGLKNGELLADLNYIEDSSIDLDMNIVLTHSGRILEIQGNAEGSTFDREQVNEIIKLAEVVLRPCMELQQAACEGHEVEG